MTEDWRAMLRRWAVERAPEEACGLLVGEVRDGRFRVARAVLLDNVAEGDRTKRYALEPLEHLRVDRAARAEDLDVVGCWHSHPAGDAVPSEADLRAVHEGWVYAIVGAKGRVRTWRLSGAGFDEVLIEPDE